MLDVDTDALTHELSDALAMAMVHVALVAEQAHAFAGFDDAGKLVELGLPGRSRQVRLVDPKEVVEPAGAGSEPPLFRRTEASQVQVGDTTPIEAGSKLSLGESRTT